MPWQTTSMNDVKKEFVLKALTDGQDFSQLCREFNISRKTGYKWKHRALQDGLGALAERSRRPRRSPQRLDEDTLCALIRLKLRHPHWGAKKLGLVYARAGGRPPSLSTFQRILTKAGLVAVRRKRARAPVGRLQAQVTAREPNDVRLPRIGGQRHPR
jgi:transposase-like protein